MLVHVVALSTINNISFLSWSQEQVVLGIMRDGVHGSGGLLAFESRTLSLECIARTRCIRLTMSSSGREYFPIVVTA
jgi:hypothetical protein